MRTMGRGEILTKFPGIAYSRKGHSRIVNEVAPDGRSWFGTTYLGKAALMMCETRLRDPWTGALGAPVPRMYVVEMHDKLIEEEGLGKVVRVVMFCLAAKGPSNSAELGLFKSERFDHAGLAPVNPGEYAEKVALLTDLARVFENQRAKLEDMAPAVGITVEHMGGRHGP